MTSDHVFVDSLGTSVGRPEIEVGWPQYFQIVPDFWIRIEEAVNNLDTVSLFGTTGGTYVPPGGEPCPENRWETPAAWRVKVKDGKVAEWRVYADNEPIRQRMKAAAAPKSA